MFSRFNPRFVALTLASLALTLAPPPAHACGGGMFTSEVETQTTKMSGHRVAISISTEQTVLWDQIKYQGDPKDFAWVMPVKTGATLEVGSDAWLEALDASTTTVITSPEAYCGGGASGVSSGGCCGSATALDGSGNGDIPRSQEPPVEVIHRATVGPYETVTLSSKTPGAISEWLTMHGYAIPADVQPILDDYVAQGFDFLAARLTPGQGVEQIKPLRVVTPGALTTFPMRMLAAGAQKNVALSLFVITEGRNKITGFSSAMITGDDLTWDFNNSTSDYVDVRAKKLAADSGRTFLTTYAAPRGLLGPVPVAAPASEYDTEKPPIVVDLFARARDNQESGAECSSDFSKYINSMAKVTDMPGAGETDPSVFSCGKVDDLGVALTGLHPNDVWVTRFEADLPREALTADLTIEPLADQTPVENHLNATKSTGNACASMAPVFPARPRHLPPRDAALAAALLGLGAAVARRLARTGRARGIKIAST